MPKEDEPLLDDEQDEQDWADYISQFKEEVFPIFEHQGFTLPEAFLAWKLNEVSHRINKLGKDLW